MFEARSLVQSVLDETCGVVAGLQGLTRSGQDIEIELLLLPLRHAGRTHARLLGSISSVSPAPWIGLDPVIQMTLRSVRIIRDGDVAPPTPLLRTSLPASSPVQPERRGSFMVYAGGKQSPNVEDQHSN